MKLNTKNTNNTPKNVTAAELARLKVRTNVRAGKRPGEVLEK
jgi:hypothetical protein